MEQRALTDDERTDVSRFRDVPPAEAVPVLSWLIFEQNNQEARKLARETRKGDDTGNSWVGTLFGIGNSSNRVSQNSGRDIRTGLGSFGAANLQG